MSAINLTDLRVCKRRVPSEIRARARWRAVVLMLAAGLASVAPANEIAPGRSVESLLEYAKTRNPEYAVMRFEADAAGERIAAAGAFPDPKLRTEWMDITKSGQQNPTLWPSRVETTRYTLMQDIPWFGKRELKRDIAVHDADAAKGRLGGAWVDLASRIKTAYAQLYVVRQNERLTREILDLLLRLESVAQARYAGGLAAQQDVIRAQVEQSMLKNELIGLDNERRQLKARLNALLARPLEAALAEPQRLRALPAPAALDYVTLQDRVRGGNPQLFSDEARIKTAEKFRELTYRNRYPDFTVSVAPSQYQSALKQWDVMIEFNVPLQQSFRRAQERESEAMLSAARARRDASANMLLGELSESLSALDAARRLETLTTNELLPQAELTFQAALPGYETGKVDFATLLDAQRQIRQARLNLLRAQAESQARLAQIERILGEDL